MRNLHTRILTEKELPEALTICREVFMQFEAPEYPPEGVRNFLDFLEPESIRRMVSGGLLIFVGTFHDGKLVGTGAVRERKHLCLLFVKEKYQRQGVGSALLEKILRLCRKTETITVHASPYGVPFYLARGFVPLSEEQCRDGIRFIPMERTL